MGEWINLTPDSLIGIGLDAQYKYVTSEYLHRHKIRLVDDDGQVVSVALVGSEAEKLLEILQKWKEGK